MLTKSEIFKQEYCCTIVRVGQVQPIDNSDFLAQVMVEGRTIVIRKDYVHEGDLMFYIANECHVNADFLRAGNYFEDRTMNADPERKGYLNGYGRIRMEYDEPLCRGKVPREGICIRIMNDPVNECFKLKTLSFLGKGG